MDISNNAWKENNEGNVEQPPRGLPSGSHPSVLYQTVRYIMGAIKRSWNRSNVMVASTGTATAWSLAYEVGPSTGLVKGEVFRFFAHVANTGAVTLNVNFTGARPIVNAVGAPLVAGDIVIGQVVSVTFDGTSFRLLADRGVSPPVPTASASDNSTRIANTAFTQSLVSTTATNVLATIRGGVVTGFDTLKKVSDRLEAHETNTSNPHNVTALQAGAVNRTGDSGLTGTFTTTGGFRGTLEHLNNYFNINSYSTSVYGTGYARLWYNANSRALRLDAVGDGSGTISLVGVNIASGLVTGLGSLATKSTVLTADIGNDQVTAAKIARNAVTFNELTTIPTGTLVGRTASGTGDATGLTAAQVKGMLDYVSRSGDTMSGDLTTTGSTIQIQREGSKHFWMRNSAGNEHGLMWWDSTTGLLSFRCQSGSAMQIHPNGNVRFNGSGGGSWISEIRAWALSGSDARTIVDQRVNEIRTVSESIQVGNIDTVYDGHVVLNAGINSGVLRVRIAALQIHRQDRGWSTMWRN